MKSEIGQYFSTNSEFEVVRSGLSIFVHLDLIGALRRTGEMYSMAKEGLVPVIGSMVDNEVLSFEEGAWVKTPPSDAALRRGVTGLPWRGIRTGLDATGQCAVPGHQMTSERHAAVEATILERAGRALQAGWVIHVDPITEPGILCIALKGGELFTFFVRDGNDLPTEFETLAFGLQNLGQESTTENLR